MLIKTFKSDPLPKNSPKHIYFDFDTWVKLVDGHNLNMVIAQYADASEFCFPKDDQLMAENDAVTK